MRLSLNIVATHMKSDSSKAKLATNGLLIVLGLIVAAVLVWQAMDSAGSPDPTKPNRGHTAAIFDIGVLVFREGLECILVLSAITASMIGANRSQRKPVAVGAGVGFLATIVTWFIAVGIESKLSESVSALNLQAATGLLAVIVLLVIMNWFLHKIYWGGWITMHNRKRRELLDQPDQASAQSKLLLGLGLLGFSSLYREGFEIVLFLQTYYLQLGGRIVFAGVSVGLMLTSVVAVLNFILHQRLPYRKMLIFTGLMLGLVLLVMVGEQAQEMQQAHWISTTTIPWMTPHLPDWMGVWFSLFPTVETLCAQLGAAILVVGSYFLASRLGSHDSPDPSPA